MKKLILVLLLVGLTGLGCTYLGEHHTAAMACLSDPTCSKEVDQTVNPWKKLAEASGYPVAGVAVGVVGTYLVAFFKKKKKVV